MTASTPEDVVRLFLESMALGDADTAVALIHPDIEYVNVSLPTLRSAGTTKVVRLLDNPRLGFGVNLINTATTNNVVLTERIDELRAGRFRTQFWVCGRFEVQDNRITVWRDYFDWFDITKATFRGLLALAIPSLQTPLPAPVNIFGKK
ncbi:limonene-1,2-epoxide hydrolase family protein [Nocardia terpenica]|uniref:Limonene-1,2-epoxide hydrolase n=1 Tax=Nocardia terpenica TaxID=455432 RepID=A0A6G9ZA27_9NOCA|nr:limonene-1,2-epoxide hydrolase family protein [Nocardia terpenica]QIS22314.1 limonene-1,2-epoxide hydrolase [Nocardia terpenica]